MPRAADLAIGSRSWTLACILTLLDLFFLILLLLILEFIKLVKICGS